MLVVSLSRVSVLQGFLIIRVSRGYVKVEGQQIHQEATGLYMLRMIRARMPFSTLFSGYRPYGCSNLLQSTVCSRSSRFVPPGKKP